MTDPIHFERFEGEDLLKWHVAHEMSVHLEEGALIVSDTKQYNWHLLRISGSEYLYRMIRMRVVLRKYQTSTVNFYIHHFGSQDVAEIALDGLIVNKGTSRYLSVAAAKDEEDILEIEVEFLNCHPTLSIGCSVDRHPIYSGSGRRQFAILLMQVESYDATSALSEISDDERIRLVDVGGQEGLQLKWMLRAAHITPVLFEPIPTEAEKVRETVERIPGARVIEAALAHTSGTRTLHIAWASGCASLRKPNFEVLNRYTIGNIFRTVRQIDVYCTRFDELFREGAVPPPDVIKIDVQGFEYEVLQGFGHLLETCLGIELETHFYSVYQEQKLFGDIVGFLDGFGFVLRKANCNPNFDGDSVEFDAFFTKRRAVIRTLPEAAKKKFALLTAVWQLEDYFG